MEEKLLSRTLCLVFRVTEGWLSGTPVLWCDSLLSTFNDRVLNSHVTRLKL